MEHLMEQEPGTWVLWAGRDPPTCVACAQHVLCLAQADMHCCACCVVHAMVPSLCHVAGSLFAAATPLAPVPYYTLPLHALPLIPLLPVSCLSLLTMGMHARALSTSCLPP